MSDSKQPLETSGSLYSNRAEHVRRQTQQRKGFHIVDSQDVETPLYPAEAECEVMSCYIDGKTSAPWHACVADEAESG